jgi:2-polyprenyl-3-methyl-5-hydroxy-6-metoxy-1,4-benzoquinol methylase
MFDRAAHWEGVYSTKAENEVSWFQATPAISLEMIKEAGRGPDAAIIDVGGGESRLVDALLRDGYRSITVLDLSRNAVETTKRRLGHDTDKVEWIVADVTTWTPARTYDIWHDRAAFHFLTDPADRAAYLDRLHSALAANGQAIIATFALDGPEKCSGLPVQRYDPDTLARELGPSFRLADSRRQHHHTPWNSVQSFQFSRFVRA